MHILLITHKIISKRLMILDINRHYCRVRSCREFMSILSCKCFFATSMLVFFLVLAVSFAHAMLNIDTIGADRFDFIIIGAGPAGMDIVFIVRTFSYGYLLVLYSNVLYRHLLTNMCYTDMFVQTRTVQTTLN